MNTTLLITIILFTQENIMYLEILRASQFLIYVLHKYDYVQN